jgi:hypothetical protein
MLFVNQRDQHAVTKHGFGFIERNLVLIEISGRLVRVPLKLYRHYADSSILNLEEIPLSDIFTAEAQRARRGCMSPRHSLSRLQYIKRIAHVSREKFSDV